LFRDRSSMVVSLALLLGASTNLACDNNKKKSPGKPVTEPASQLPPPESTVSTADADGAKDGKKDEDKRPAATKKTSDVSSKLTSDEKKSLNRFACKYQDTASKFAAFAQLIKDGDRDTIDAISSEYDKEKVDALIKLAKAVGGSESKAKATLKAICDDSSASTD